MSQGVRNNPEAPVFLCLSKLPTVPISSHQGSSNARNNPDHLEDIPALDEFGERSRWKFSAHWSLLIRGEYFEIVRTGLSMEFAPNRNVKHDVFYKKRIGTTRLSNEQIKDEGFYDLISRNCQTTTKDLANRIIFEEDRVSNFKWPLDSIYALKMVILAAAVVCVGVIYWYGAVATVNMAVDAVKGFLYTLEKLVNLDGTPIAPWPPSKLTGFEIILKFTSFTVGSIRDLLFFFLDDCAAVAHSIFTLNGQALWTSAKNGSTMLAFLSGIGVILTGGYMFHKYLGAWTYGQLDSASARASNVPRDVYNRFYRPSSTPQTSSTHESNIPGAGASHVSGPNSQRSHIWGW